VGHCRPFGAVHFIEAGRVDQNDLRLSQPWHDISSALPSQIPHVLSPAAAHIDLGDRFANQRIDQRRLARADFAKDDNLHLACGQLLGHCVQLIEITLQRLALLRAAAAKMLDRAANRSHRSFVVAVERCSVRASGTVCEPRAVVLQFVHHHLPSLASRSRPN
jgi:hypothetical protein